MAAKPHALSTVPPEPPADTDYDAICAAVTATARGRWFLEEYAKRNRNSDTLEVLAAIARMETAVVGDRAQQASREAHQEVRIELLEMARTIAQTRAEVAESRPQPSQHLAAAAASTTAAPDIATAAERLRQIAWTMRACGIDLPASDQIGQIADAILSADALRGLGEQRAQKLTEALHYLEHRIDRMLDGYMAVANGADAEPAAESPAPEADPHDREASSVTRAVAMIAAAMHSHGAEMAEAEPAPSPAMAQTSAAALSQAAASAAPDVAEYPMDDDVVLTVADSPVEQEPEPAIALAPEPEPEQEPTIAHVAPAPTAQAIEPEELQDERVGLEFEPLVPTMPPTAAADGASFAGLELEPLAVAPTVAAEPPIESNPVVAEDTPAAAAMVEPAAEPDAPDSGANDNLPLMLVTDVATTPARGDDVIAMQVDQDLAGLTDAAPDDGGNDAAAPVTEPVSSRVTQTQATLEDDTADLLLEAASHKVPMAALVASAQAARAQLSDTLAAIESELFGSTRPDAPADSPPSTVVPPAAAKAAGPRVTQGPLAALMAMSEEERIAVFS